MCCIVLKYVFIFVPSINYNDIHEIKKDKWQPIPKI